MNASSPTLTLSLACPAWCVDEHDITDVVGMSVDGVDRLALEHSGPNFGPFSTGAETDVLTGEIFGASVSYDDVVTKPLDGSSDPAAFRQLAAQALAAAEWLEAQR